MKFGKDLRKSIALKAHQLRIVDPGEKLVTGFESPSHQEFNVISEKMTALVEVAFSLPGRFFYGDLKKFGEAIGLTPSAIEAALLLDEELTIDSFYRGDLLRQDGKWKLLELNMGSTVGGLFYASLNRLAGGAESFDVLRSWAQELHRRYQFEGSIALVEDSRDFEYMALSLPVMARELEEVSGCRCLVLGHRDLKIVDGKLCHKNFEIKYLINLFNEQNLNVHQAEYTDIIKACQNQTAKIVLGPKYRLFANKGVLALLHELANQEALAPSEVDLVKEFIPETGFVTRKSVERILASKNAFVLKPIDGFAGKNVYSGPDIADSNWSPLLRKILDGAEAYVFQEYIKPEVRDVVLTSQDGSELNQRSRLLWGVFAYGNQYLGTFIRAKPDSGSSVINHANGASVGPIPAGRDE